MSCLFVAQATNLGLSHFFPAVLSSTQGKRFLMTPKMHLFENFPLNLQVH